MILLVWAREPVARAARKALFVDAIAPALLAAGARRLSVDVADADAAVPSPSPFPLRAARPVAMINAFVDDLDTVEALLGVVRGHGLDVHAWQVEPSIYRDYGDNGRCPPRDWPDGERSPGILTVNLLERPARMDRDRWVAHWHGVMSPVSEAIQPRTRYVRNLVLQPLTPDAPPYEGIVEECWPTRETLSDVWAFYGARTVWQLVRNQLAILRAVTGFLTLWRVMTIPMSEYAIRTDA